MKIYVVGGAIHYSNFIQNVELVDTVEDADVVLFTGGEDVTPSHYGCKAHYTTNYNEARDRREEEIFKKVRPKQLCVGVCRGSQLMCVLNGGILVQNCTGHALWGTHAITDGDKVYEITSTHHQMQYPYFMNKNNYTILYTSRENLSSKYEGDNILSSRVEKYGEPEIVLYHKKDYPKCLAIQGHPEMIPESQVAKMLNDLIVELVNGNK